MSHQIHEKMQHKQIHRPSSLLSNSYKFIHATVSRWLPTHKWIRRIAIGGIVLVLLLMTSMYGIAQWYIASNKNTPFTQGVSFIPDYASSLGLDPHQTLQAILGELGVKHLRLVSYWSDIEPQPGQFNFQELDYEFAQSNEANAKVSLSLGLRQPRWPECHMPNWAQNEPASVWQPQLENFVTTVVNRYKHNPALSDYQLENEYFLRQFGFYGACQNFDRTRLVSEYNLVKSLDPTHQIMLARSNNALGWAINAPTPDIYGISIYKRVWDKYYTHRYAEYPFPAWYYAFLAGVQKIINGRDTIIHEMQAEPWPPQDQNITQISLSEQNKSFSAVDFQNRIQFAKATGMRTVYYWGAEYWYYRLTVEHDPSVWQIAKQTFHRSE